MLKGGGRGHVRERGEGRRVQVMGGKVEEAKCGEGERKGRNGLARACYARNS